MITKDIFMLCKSMLPEETDKINDDSHLANIKFDGERIIAVVLKNDVILFNRRGKICNFNFREVVEDLKKINQDVILDGEVISREDDFTKLMTRARITQHGKIAQREKDVPIKYMVFDILKSGEQDLRQSSLHNRIKEMNKVVVPTENVEVAEFGNVKDMLIKAREQKREGIVVKNIYSDYESRRSENWLKVKFFKETTFKAIRYTSNNAGIRVEDSLGRAVQITGQQHEEVKQILDSKGEVEIYIQYLSQNADNGNYRFPSYRGLVGGENV